MNNENFKITNKQYDELWDNLGLPYLVPVHVDRVIDWLRIKFNIIIFNAAAPFVDPVKKTIMYSYTVKFCNTNWGWNCREIIGQTKWSKNIYAMKRQAIWIAIRYLKKKQKQNRHCKRLSISKK